MELFRARVLLIVVSVTIVLAIGTVGFTIVEGWPVFDAFYMSLISITTVGYKEVHDLSRAGQVFNVFFLLLGVSVMFLSIGAVTQLVIAAQLEDFFGRRRMKRMIERMDDHYLLCGYGRVGRAAAEELMRSGVPFVLIDSDHERIELAQKNGIVTLQADAASDETLKEAGIQRAKGLIAALATDAQNLFLVLSAKALNRRLKVSSRVVEEESEIKFRRAGADATFRPYNITGFRLAQAMLRPHVFEFLDLTTPTADFGHNIGIEQIKVAENCDLANKSLKDMQLRRNLDVIVMAVRRASGSMEFNPSADTVVQGNDYLIVMGDLQQMSRLEKLAGSAS